MPEVKIRALYIFECEFLTRPKCDALRDFVPFVQFKKREKHPWSIAAITSDTVYVRNPYLATTKKTHAKRKIAKILRSTKI